MRESNPSIMVGLVTIAGALFWCTLGVHAILFHMGLVPGWSVLLPFMAL